MLSVSLTSLAFFLCGCSLGLIDVVHYYLETGQISADFRGIHQRSLVFMAVVHSQPAVLTFLLSNVSSS